MRRAFRLASVMLLTAAGLWCLSQGAWIHVKARLAQALIDQAWERSRQTGVLSPPWPWADTWPMARMQIQGLDETLMILHGDSGRVLAFGPGHSVESALPGEPGTVLISGHRDTHFSVLQKIEKGHVIRLETHSGSHSYRVEGMRVVDADRFRIRSSGEERLVLVTCYPFDDPIPGGPQRFVVSASRISSARKPHRAALHSL